MNAPHAAHPGDRGGSATAGPAGPPGTTVAAADPGLADPGTRVAAADPGVADPGTTMPGTTMPGTTEAGAMPAGGRRQVAGEDPDELPSLTVQVAEQIGGVRGITEASIPVAVFVVVNIVVGLWPAMDEAVGLWPALYGSVGTALAIAAYRLARRQPIRHAVNGLFGIALGAVFVLRSGQARDFHVTAILWSLGYGVALLASTLVRWPLVGFIWSVTFGGGDTTWRDDGRMRRVFGWLTVAWATVYLVKSCVLFALWAERETDALGVARLVLGYPTYAAVLAGTVYVVRRAFRRPAFGPAG